MVDYFPLLARTLHVNAFSFDHETKRGGPNADRVSEVLIGYLVTRHTRV